MLQNDLRWPCGGTCGSGSPTATRRCVRRGGDGLFCRDVGSAVLRCRRPGVSIREPLTVGGHARATTEEFRGRDIQRLWLTREGPRCCSGRRTGADGGVGSVWRGWHVDECEAGDPDLDGADDRDDDGAVDHGHGGSATFAACARPDAGARGLSNLRSRGPPTPAATNGASSATGKTSTVIAGHRAEVLISESAVPMMMKPGTCTVASGQWTDPWSAAGDDRWARTRRRS